MSIKVKPRSRSKRRGARLLLHRLHIPPSHMGYHYLKIAIPLFAKNKSQAITKELYPNVAKIANGTTCAAIERGIRHVIMIAWECRDERIWNRYFPGATRPPTNKIFIATLAEYI